MLSETILQTVLNGLTAGMIYVLVALGLTLVFGIMRIVQLAHGEIYMLGGYTFYFLRTLWLINPIASAIICMLVAGLFGVILEKVFFRRFRGRLDLACIVAIALIMLLQTGAVVTFGTSTLITPKIVPGVYSFLGVTLSWERVAAVLVSMFLLLALMLFIRRTKTGQAMLAVSQDRDAAALQGISVDRISSIAMFIGCSLAAIAGALMGSIFYLTPFMGGFALLKGIAVIILGGMGSIMGVIVAGLALGFVDASVPIILSSEVAGIIDFSIIILVLLIRPQGIFGHE